MDIFRRRTFGALDDIKADPITLGQGFETLPLYCGMMHKQILAAFLLDKTKPFLIIKPFHFSFWHLSFSFLICSIF